ncbi:hypothetical protein ABEX78_21355 [Priestia megaterium]
MAKVNVNFQIELDDTELEKIGLTAEQYAESLTIFHWGFESPGIVVCQNVDNEKYGDKIADNISYKSMNAKVIKEFK